MILRRCWFKICYAVKGPVWLLPFHSFFQHKKEKVNAYADFENIELMNVVGVYIDGSLNMNNIYDKPIEMVPRATGSLKKSIC